MANSLYPPWMRDLPEEARKKERRNKIAREKAQETQKKPLGFDRQSTPSQQKWAEEVAALRSAKPAKKEAMVTKLESYNSNKALGGLINLRPEGASDRQRFRSPKAHPPVPDEELREIRSVFRDFLGGVVPNGVPEDEEANFQNVRVDTAAIWLRSGSISPHGLARRMVLAGYKWSDAWRVVNAALAMNGEFR